METLEQPVPGKDKKVFLFAFMNEDGITPTEKLKFRRTLNKFGGICKMEESMYVSDSTHIVVPNQIAQSGKKWCPKLFGALAGGKHVITTQYLIDSETSGGFLNEHDFIPPFVAPIVDHFSTHGKPFVNQTAIVIINNPRRQAELKLILRDGGANVPNWSVTDLLHKPLHETLRLDIIYTDTMQEKTLQKFVDKFSTEKDENRHLKVLSYFCIFKVITMPVVGKERREIMELQFDVNNKELMSKLHPQTAEPQLPTNRSHRGSRLGPRDNEGRIVAEIKLESEDSDSDVQVVSDDECQVVEAKIKPRKKRKPSSGFKDFQYEVPGQQNKKRKEDSEIIDLASSDDEEEPISNGSSEPLPLPVPITKVSQGEKSSSGSGKSSSKDKIEENQHEVSDDDRPDWHYPASSIDDAEMEIASPKDTCDNLETNKDLENEKLVDRNTNQNEDVPKVTNDKHKTEPKSNQTLINGNSTEKGKQDPPEVQVKTFVGQNTGWAVSPAEPKVPEKEEGSKTNEMVESLILESSVLPQQESHDSESEAHEAMDTQMDDIILPANKANSMENSTTEQPVKEDCIMEIGTPENDDGDPGKFPPGNNLDTGSKATENGKKAAQAKTKMLVNINLFDKKDEKEPEKDDGSGGSEHEEEDEEDQVGNESIAGDENAPELVKFTSEDLTDEICTMYFKAFKTYQRDFLTGMDVSDEMEKKSPKFDANRESELCQYKRYFDKNSNPFSSPFPQFELDNIFAEIEFNLLTNLPLKLALFRTLLSSRHFFPAKTLVSLIRNIRDIKAKEHDRSKLEILVHQFMEFLYAQLSLHTISTAEKRLYYHELFGGDVATFVHEYVENYKEDTFGLLMLNFTVEVLRQDFFQWRKHDMSNWIKEKDSEQKEKLVPLINAFKIKERFSDLITDIKDCKANNFGVKALLLKLFSFIAVFLGFGDEKDDEGTLSMPDTWKHQVAKGYMKIGFPNDDLKSMFVTSFLLRPSWLSTIVLVKAALKSKDNTESNVEIDLDVVKLLRHLPTKKTGTGTLSKLQVQAPEYILMVMNQLLQTLPVNKIAMAILKDKDAIVDKVKFKAIKPKVKDGKEKLEKVTFDSRVSLRPKDLYNDIGLCIDLLNRIRLSDDGDTRDVSVGTRITRWHFM